MGLISATDFIASTPGVEEKQQPANLVEVAGFGLDKMSSQKMPLTSSLESHLDDVHLPWAPSIWMQSAPVGCSRCSGLCHMATFRLVNSFVATIKPIDFKLIDRKIPNYLMIYNSLT